ncbi:dihydrodipicolinate reductase [Streptomyces sp. C]|nr:dihydrodipicolinate reductase [Streptomyces sp. C]
MGHRQRRPRGDPRRRRPPGARTHGSHRPRPREGRPRRRRTRRTRPPAGGDGHPRHRSGARRPPGRRRLRRLRRHPPRRRPRRHHPRHHRGRGRRQPRPLPPLRPPQRPAGVPGPRPRRDRRGRRFPLRLRRRPRLGQRRAPAADQRPGHHRGRHPLPGDLRLLHVRPADSVRHSSALGHPMDYEPMMLMPSIPTMVWGGQIRMMARALGVELDEIRETSQRRALDTTVSTPSMGVFEAGTQGAVRFEVQGVVGGEPRIVIEHVTRIHPSCAPDWPVPPDGGAGAHRVVIEGRPRIEVTVEATDEGENRSAGGNATAVGRLVGAIDWLVAAEPGLYDALDVPLRPAVGRLGRKQP